MSMSRIVCVCVFFALDIRYANRILYALCYISICGLFGCTILFHIVTNGANFGKDVIEFKMCVLIFCSYNICLKHFSFSENSTAGFHKFA